MTIERDGETLGFARVSLPVRTVQSRIDRVEGLVWLCVIVISGMAICGTYYLVARTIRGKNAGRALVDLEFSKKRVAQDVRKLLQSAIANAENNHGMDVDSLIVSEAYVGNQIKMKRFRARARGRGARIEKKFANMTIIVKEAQAKA